MSSSVSLINTSAVLRVQIGGSACHADTGGESSILLGRSSAPFFSFILNYPYDILNKDYYLAVDAFRTFQHKIYK